MDIFTMGVAAKNTKGDKIESLWIPPTMPDTKRGNGIVPTSYDPDEQLAAMFDPLVDNDYVTKRKIGRDNSDTYDIWCYEFTPENPEKTILLTSLVHGNEYTSFYWLSQFCDLLVNHWEDYPQFRELRKTVRFVTVPIVNPWGHANQMRTNSSVVDISRNFAYNHGMVFDEYPQGLTAFSESEARAIRDLMAEIADECVASLDFHTTLSEGSTDLILYYPRFLKNNISRYIALVEEMKKAGADTTALATTALPTLTNYGILKHGFNSANPEFFNGLRGATRGSEEMTRVMGFFSNFVFQAAKVKFKNAAESIDLPTVASIKYDHRVSGLLNFATTTYTTQGTKTAVKFKAKNEGVFKVSGQITVTVTADAEVSIIPHLYQVQSPDFGYTATLTDEYNAIIATMKAGEERTIPFSAEILCHKTNKVAIDNTNERPQEIVFQFRTKISAGSGAIKFIKAEATLLPTTSGDRYQRYTINPTTMKYPSGEGTGYEF